MLSLNLCVFDTSKGHFGRTDIYQRTINSLAAQAPLKLVFKNLIAHIKVGGEKEEAVFQEQKKFYENLGFTVIRSDAEWKHFSDSHQRGYSADLVKVYGNREIQNADYTLHLESDWLFTVKSRQQLIDVFSAAINYLRKNPSAVSVRIPRFQNEIERIKGLKQKFGIDAGVYQDEISNKFYRTNDNLSLNPSIFRTRDLWAATRILKQNFDKLSQHVEMGFTHAFTHLADGEYPFAFFDPKIIIARHIGTESVDKDDPVEGAFENE